jgi:hypothetical protein
MQKLNIQRNHKFLVDSEAWRIETITAKQRRRNTLFALRKSCWHRFLNTSHPYAYKNYCLLNTLSSSTSSDNGWRLISKQYSSAKFLLSKSIMSIQRWFARIINNQSHYIINQLYNTITRTFSSEEFIVRDRKIYVTPA